MILAAAQARDIVVLVAALAGAALVIAGLASLHPDIRPRLPVAAIAEGNTAMSAGLIIAGLLLFGLVLA